MEREAQSLPDRVYTMKVSFAPEVQIAPVNKAVMVPQSSVSTCSLQVGVEAEIILLPTSSDSESGWSELNYKVTSTQVTMDERCVLTEVGKRGPGIYIADCDLRRSNVLGNNRFEEGAQKLMLKR